MFIQINNDLFGVYLKLNFFKSFTKDDIHTFLNFNVNFISPWGRGKSILKNSEFIVKIFY